MKTKIRSEVTSIILSVLLVFAMIPCFTGPAHADSESPIDIHPVISGEALSWDQVSDADAYYVFVEDYGFYVDPSMTSITRSKLNSYIDHKILNNEVAKSDDNYYTVKVEACDKNNTTIAYGEIQYEYDCPYSPVAVGAITGLKITKATKTATWNAYTSSDYEVSGYEFELSGSSNGSAQSASKPKFAYGTMLAQLKKLCNFKNASAVRVTVTAYTYIEEIDENVTIARATRSLKYSDLVKLTNTLKVSGKTAAVKYNILKKRAQTLKRAKVLAVSLNKGKVTYAKVSGNKKILINKTTGKVTVKKGLKKGLYKVKVKVKAAGNANYNALTKKVTFKIRVR